MSTLKIRHSLGHGMATVPVPVPLFYSGCQTFSRAGDAKNLWVQIGHLWKLYLGTYNVRAVANEGSLEVLFKEDVKLDTIGLNEVRGTGEFIKLKNGHILCYRVQKDNKEY